MFKSEKFQQTFYIHLHVSAVLVASYPCNH